MGSESHAEPLRHLIHRVGGVVPHNKKDDGTNKEHEAEQKGIGEMEREVEGEDTQEKVTELVEDIETSVEVVVIADGLILQTEKVKVVVLGGVFDFVVVKVFHRWNLFLRVRFTGDSKGQGDVSRGFTR